jgi:PAS domain S-box-containing protein
VAHHATFSGNKGRSPQIKLSAEVQTGLKDGPVVRSTADDDAGIQLKWPGSEFRPSTIAIIPFFSRVIQHGFLILVDDDSQQDRLSALLNLMQQIINIAVVLLDNRYLLDELQTVNAELDLRVQTRTADLEASNRQLLAEVSERKKSEAALRASEEKFRQLFHNANDAIYLWELSDSGDVVRCLEVNDVACQILGYSRAEMLKMTPPDLESEQSQQRIPGIMRQLNREGRITFETTHLTREGVRIPVEIRSQRFKLANKRVILSIARDITDRKHTEEMLKRQNDYLTALHETAIGVVSLNERDDLLRDIVERACRLADTPDGYVFLYDSDCDELVLRIGSGLFESMQGLRLKSGQGMAGRVWRQGRSIRVDDYSQWEHRHPDSRFDCVGESLGCPLKFANRTMGVIGLSTGDRQKQFDVDSEEMLSSFAELASIAIHNARLNDDLRQELKERTQAQSALKDAHETFLTVLDGIDATIYAADMDTYEILFMNKYMKEAFAGDHEGHKCWAAFRDTTGPCQDCTNPKLLDDNGSPTGVHVWEGQNPITGCWYLNHDRAIKWPDGRYVRMQIATDISRIKELESARRQNEARMRQSHKMEAIGTLAGGIAHDFNNILSAIIGFTELSLIETEKRSTLHTNLKEVINAGNRAKDLVSQILTFSRHGEYQVKPVQLGPITKEALKLMRSTLPSTVEIRQQIDDDLDPVLADATQIHQILINLCTNAAHAMKPDGGVLEVKLEKADIDSTLADGYSDIEPGPYLLLQVSDNGSGIPDDIIDSIFDPYFTTKKPGEGTGLGLSVVHGIVKSYWGDIRVQTQLGRGTTFEIVLPTVKDDTLQQKSESTPLPTGNEHILLVDDEPALVKIGQQMLISLGYKVVTHTESSRALEIFNNQPWAFDLVISDMTMPGLTGEKLAQEMLDVRPDIPVILYTGFSQQISEQNAYALGIRAFLYKPINLEKLARTVRTVLDGLKN